MSDPIFGVVFRKTDTEARPAIKAKMDTVGIVGPMSGVGFIAADFPLNTPVKGYTDDADFIASVGTGGFIPDALRGVQDQLGDLQRSCEVVLIRTAEGSNADPQIKLQQTIGNIVGSSTLGTGLHAFVLAPELVAVAPRILIAPGYTSMLADGVAQLTRTTPGAGYVQDVEYDLVFTGGGANAVQAEGYAVGLQDGSLGPAILRSSGAWYTTPPTVAAEAPERHVTAAVIAAGGTGHQVGDKITLANGVVLAVETVNAGVILTTSITEVGSATTAPANPVAQASTTGVGAGATFTLTWSVATAATYSVAINQLGNPVCAAFPTVCNMILAHAVVESAGTSQQNDEDWRETLNSERLIPISGGVKVQDVDDPLSPITTKPAAPRVAGLLVRVDHNTGGPFRSAANQPVFGIVGPGRAMRFDITAGGNEGQAELANNIGIIVKGEIGSDFSIASGGYVFIGTDNAGEDELWRFYNQTRGRDFIHLTMLSALRFFLGRSNVTVQTINAVITSMEDVLMEIQSGGNLIGYRVNWRTKDNNASNIRKGWITVLFQAEEPAPLRKITTLSARYRPAIDAMVASLEAQLNFSRF